MPNLDSILSFFGLCRNSHFIKMQDNYARVISMKTSETRRAKDRNLQLTIELAQVRADLDAAQTLIQRNAYIRDAG